MQGYKWGINRNVKSAGNKDFTQQLKGRERLGYGAENDVYEDTTNPQQVLKVPGDRNGLITPHNTQKGAIREGQFVIKPFNKLPFNLPLNIEGTIKTSEGKYIPVFSQRKVYIPKMDQKKIIDFDKSVNGMYSLEKPNINNILLENDIQGAADFKLPNIGLLPDGTVMGVDLWGVNRNNILGNYTYKTPSTDIGTIDFLKEFFNRQKIQGVEYTMEGLKQSSKNVQTGLPENIKGYLNENTVERNIRAMRQAGYSEREIQMYKDKVNEEMSNVRVGQYSGEDYKAANSEDFGGFFNAEDNFISINKDAHLNDPRFTPDYVMKHEGRHLIDYRTGMTDKLNKILEEAYDKDFLDIPNHKDAGSLKGYQHMNRERVTTNRDARDVLLSSKGKALQNEHNFMLYASKKGLSNSMVDFQNKIIKYAQPEDIVDAVEKSNGYGKRYIRYLRENNKLTPEKIEQFRQAMMHVGGYVAPIVEGYTLYNLLNNQKQLEYRKQGGKLIFKYEEE